MPFSAAPMAGDMLTRKENAVEEAYRFFAHSAELEDDGAAAPAAAWQTLGKVICALISSEDDRRPPSAARDSPGEVCRSVVAEMEQRLERASRDVGFLTDAGARGGNISASTVRWFVDALSTELDELQHQVRRLQALSLEDASVARLTGEAARLQVAHQKPHPACVPRASPK